MIPYYCERCGDKLPRQPDDQERPARLACSDCLFKTNAQTVDAASWLENYCPRSIKEKLENIPNKNNT